MSNLFNIITKLFGNKYKKEIKSIEPIVEEINSEFKSIQELSNNDLREKTQNFILKIQDSYKNENDLIKNLKEEIKKNKNDILKQKDIYDEINKTELEINEKNKKHFKRNLATGICCN